MKTSLLVLLVSLALLLRAAYAAEKSSDPSSFHPPQTEAEKMLDATIHSQDRGESAMTPGLRSVIAREAGKNRNGTCVNPGKQLDSLLCENFHPESAIVCGAVSGLHYLYRTLFSNGHEAVVEVALSGYEKDKDGRWPKYRLIGDAASWRVDGIDCNGLYKYNISVKELLDRYHLPAPGPEKIVDTILRYDEDELIDLHSFIFSDRRPSRPGDEKLLPLFTKEFLDRSKKELRTLITQSCGGKEPGPEDDCDMVWDYDVITCAQDRPEFYLYRTIKIEKKKAIVIATWPNYMTDLQAYELVQDDRGDWRLDAIYCDGYGKKKRG